MDIEKAITEGIVFKGGKSPSGLSLIHIFLKEFAASKDEELIYF